MTQSYQGDPQPPVRYVGQPPVHYVQSSTNGLAVTAMVLGIAGFFTFGALSIPAVIVGHIALAGQKARDGFGRGQAVTGLVLGYLLILGWLLFWVFVVLIGVGSSSSGTVQ